VPRASAVSRGEYEHGHAIFAPATTPLFDGWRGGSGGGNPTLTFLVRARRRGASETISTSYRPRLALGPTARTETAVVQTGMPSMT
jgi:hypothetical protein